MQGVINNISNISAWANGATGLLNPNVVNSLSSAISGLNLQQAQLVLSTKNLTQEQMNQILAQAGLIASENTIQSELLQTTLAQQGLSAEKQKAVLVELGLMNSQTGELLTQKACTRADLEAILAQKGITGAQAEGILSALGLAGANTGLAFSFGLLAKSIWEAIKGMVTFLATNPVGWAILAVGGIAALTKVVDKLGTTVEEQREELETLKQEYSEITSELESLNSELSTTEQRMRELEKIESPTFAEKEEYDNLVKTNNELQRKIDLLELEEKIKSQDARDAFVSTMEKDTDRTKDDSDEYFYYVDPNDPNQQKSLGKGSTVAYSMGGFSIQAVPEDELIDVYENYANKLKELDEQYANDLENETYKETKATIEQEMADLAKYLSDKSNQWSSDANGIKYIENPTTEDDKAVNEWLDYIADFQDRMAIAMGGDNAKTNTFNRIVDNWQFDDTVQGLQDLGKEGKVTAEMLNDPKYDEFINKLVFLGVIDSADNLEDVALAFNSVADSAENAADSAGEYANRIDDLSISQTVDNLNTKLKPALDSLSSAYKDIFTSDGFTRENIGIEMLSSVKETITELNELDGVNIDSSVFEEFARVLSDTSSTSSDIQEQFNSLASAITYATSSTEISTENFEVLTKALEEMGLVDARQILTDIKTAQDEIIAQGYDLKNMTAEQAEEFINEGEVALDTVEYLRMYMIQKELSNNSLSTVNDVNNLENLCNSLGVTGDLLTWVVKLKSALGAVESGAPIEAFRGQIDEARKKIAELSTSDYGQFQFDFTGDSSKVKTDYADLLEKENILLEKQLEAGIITFKEYTDKRQSIIEDYYKQGLISAEEYYSALEDMYDYQLSLYDRVIDAVNYRIDKEIDALEKEKKSIEDTYNLKIESIQTEIDALEKAREKRQQQVELEKALFDVEEARRNRNTKLYSGTDRGVIYTNDDKELREVEENLENEKYESHISKLEEQIESLEKEMEKATDSIDKQIESLSNYADMWSDVADEYENAQNDMLASQILGANYEEEILNQRMATLEIFKNNYIAAQNAMAEANRRVLETQVNSTKTNNNPSGSKPPVDTSDEVIVPNNPYKLIVAGAVVQSFPSYDEALKYMKRNKVGGGTIKKYHSGLDEGYVGDKTPLSKDKRLEILQNAGNGDFLKPNEELDVLQKKEVVLTELQQDNIANTLLQRAIMPSINLPDYSYLNNIVPRNMSQPTIVNIGDIRMEGVQNAPDFAKALQKHLPNISVQYNGKH